MECGNARGEKGWEVGRGMGRRKGGLVAVEGKGEKKEEEGRHAQIFTWIDTTKKK